MLQKGAIQVVSPLKTEFISTVFLFKKKDGGNRPVINLKQLNSFVVYQHFKMEGQHLLKHKNRPEGCLLYSANRSRAPAAPSFYLWRHKVPVYMPSIWLGTSPPAIHQAFKACCSLSEKTGSENDYLFRRYNYIQSDSGRYFERQGLHSVAASELRLCNKLEEIGFTPSPVHGVPRFRSIRWR